MARDLEVTGAQLSESRAVAVEFDDSDLLDVESIPDAAYARPVQRPISLTMAIALPDDDAVASSITEVVAADEDGLEHMIEWVGAQEPADLRLVSMDGALWFVPPSGQLCTRELMRAGTDSTCVGEGDITPSIEFPARSANERLVSNLRGPVQ